MAAYKLPDIPKTNGFNDITKALDFHDQKGGIGFPSDACAPKSGTMRRLTPKIEGLGRLDAKKDAVWTPVS